jgi:AcrR family transcriptional regulator
VPKIVDHDARRDEIVEAVWRLVSRDGIAAATTRNIALEARCSNGVLSHYFADKGELLHAALLRGYRRVETRVEESLARAKGLEALREVLLLALPLDGESLVGNQVELAFWGFAVGNPRLAREHHVTYERFRAIVRTLLKDARRRREIPANEDVDVAGDALVALIDGLGMEASLFPDVFPPARQRAVIDRVLSGLAGTKRAAKSRARSKRERAPRVRRARA